MNSGEYQGHGSGETPAVATGPPPGYAPPPRRYVIAPPPIPAAPDPSAAPDALRLASAARRFGGALYDLVVMGLAQIVVALLVVLVAGEAYSLNFSDLRIDPTSEELLPKVVAIIAAIATAVGYHAVMSARTGAGNGPTFGKRAANIRVVSEDGRPITTRQAVRRAAAAWAPFGLAVTIGALLEGPHVGPEHLLGVSLGVGYVLMALGVFVLPLTGERRQSFHDRVAGTVVVEYDRQRPGTAGTALPVDAPALGVSDWIVGLSGTLIAGLICFALVTAPTESVVPPAGAGAGTGTTGTPTAPAPATSLPADLAAVVGRDRKANLSAVQAQAMLAPVGRQFQRCVGFHSGAAAACLTAEQLALPADAFELPSESVAAPRAGLRNALGIVFKRNGLVVWTVAYDDEARGWAYRFTRQGVSAKCYDGPRALCDEAEVAPSFQADSTATSFADAALQGYTRAQQGASTW